MTNLQTEVLHLFTAPPEDSGGSPRTISVRVPPGRLAWIDALSEHAELSRNAMVNELIRFGISAVMGQLPDAIRGDIEESLVDRLGELGETL